MSRGGLNDSRGRFLSRPRVNVSKDQGMISRSLLEWKIIDWGSADRSADLVGRGFLASRTYQSLLIIDWP